MNKSPFGIPALFGASLWILLFVSISWYSSGTDVVSIIVSAFCVLALALLYLPKNGADDVLSNSKYEILPLLSLLFFATLQFLNYRKICAFDTFGRRLDNAFHFDFLPSTVLSIESVVMYVGFSCSIAIYIVSICAFRRESTRDFSIRIFIISSLYVSLLGIYQYMCGMEIPYGAIQTQSNSFSSFASKNAAGAFIYAGSGMAFAMFLRKPSPKNVVWIFAGAINIFAVCLSESRAAKIISAAIVVAFAFALIYLLATKFGKKFSAFFCASALLCAMAIIPTVSARLTLFANVDSSDFAGRLEWQKRAFEVAENFKLYGVGLGAYMFEELPVANRQNNLAESPLLLSGHPHCDILEFFAEYGIVGGVLVASAILSYLFSLWKKRREIDLPVLFMIFTALLYFLHSCFDIFLHLGSTLILFAMLFAWIKSAKGGTE